MDAEVRWLERASTLDPFGSYLHVSAIASQLPSRAAMLRNASFLIDATTPHGDVLVNENRAIKPATGWVTIHSVEPITSGVHEWTIKIENQGETSDGSGLMLGVVPKSFCKYDTFISQGGGWCLSRAGKFYGQWKRVEGMGTTSALVFGTGDTVVFELDVEASRMTVSVGDRFIVGEISKLTPEVYPAASLHYRQQHIYFEGKRLKERKPAEGGWFQRSLHQNCGIVFHLTMEHLSRRIQQLLARGTDHRFDATGLSKWECYYKAREDVVRGVCSGVRKMIDTPEAVQSCRTEARRRHRAIRGTAMEPELPERVAAECGMELCLALLSAVSADAPGVADAVFVMLAEQLEKYPPFAFAPAHDGAANTGGMPASHFLPVESLDKIRDAARQKQTPASLRLLVALAVLRGEATEALMVISDLLEAAPELQLQVGSMLGRLSRHPAAYDLPLLRFADDTERVKVRAAIRRAPPSVWGGEKKSEKWVVHGLSSDADSLYLATGEGLLRMGSGKGTVPADIIARNATDFPGHPVSIAYANNALYVRPSAAYTAAMRLPPGHDILVVDPTTLAIVGHIAADGTGSIQTADNHSSALRTRTSAAPTTPVQTQSLNGTGTFNTSMPTTEASPVQASHGGGESPVVPIDFRASAQVFADVIRGANQGGMHHDPQFKKLIESRIISDGRYIYLVSGLPHPVAKDELGLSYPPTAPQQCRPREQAVTVTTFDPSDDFKEVRKVVLGGPRPSVLRAAKAGRRKALQMCKETYIDFGPVSEQLSSSIGHITIEMWMKPGTSDESKNVYVHGDKTAGGEVFLDIHALDSGWFVKGGARVDVRNGVRSCGAVANLPTRSWVHVALVYDGRWSLLINGAVAGMSRAEDPPVTVTRPSKRWLLGASYVGSVSEVRIWKGARSPAVILRDMHCTLTGSESGLLAYWPLDDGQGRVVYDFSHNATRQNGWVSKKPMWRTAEDFPITTDREASEDPPTPEPSPWQIFLPSVENSGMCTNGRQLAVLIQDVEDAGAGQKHGLTLYFSLDDGTLIPYNDLVAPPVDGACHFDRHNNGVWYASMTFHVLCWVPSLCTVPQPLERGGYEPLPALISPAEAAARLTDALDDRASRHMSDAWPSIFRILSIDPCAELFCTLKRLLQTQVRKLQAAGGRPTAIVAEDDKMTLMCLRLLAANFRVVHCAGIDARSLDLCAGGKAGDAAQETTGTTLHTLLLHLMDIVIQPAVKDAAALALKEGLQLFFSPRQLLALLSDLLSRAMASKQRVVEVVCLHVAGLRQALDILTSLDGGGDGDEGSTAEHLNNFFQLLMNASLAELKRVKATGSIPNRPSPITSVIASLQSAAIGGTGSERAALTSDAILAILRQHLTLLAAVSEVVAGCDDPEYALELLRWSPSGRCLGYLVISVPLLAHADLSGFLEALRDIATHWEDCCRTHAAVRDVEQEWSANWVRGDGTQDEPLGEETLASWAFTILVTIEYVAAEVAGRMVRNPEAPDAAATASAALNGTMNNPGSTGGGGGGGGANNKTSLEAWIDSPLFSGGLNHLREDHDEALEVGATQAHVRLCDEIVAGTGQGAQLWAALKQTAPSLAHVNPYVEEALRYVYAVLVRDATFEYPLDTQPAKAAQQQCAEPSAAGDGGVASTATNGGDAAASPTGRDGGGSNGSAGGGGKDKEGGELVICATLSTRFQRVVALQGWLMHLRHESSIPASTTASSYDVPPPIYDNGLHHAASDSSHPPVSALTQLVERCQFVLRFRRAPSPCDNKVVLKAMVSSGREGKKGKAKQALPPNSWRSMFHGWRAIKKLQRLLVLNHKADEDPDRLDQLLEFLSDKRVDFAEMDRVVLQRQATGRMRAAGLNYLRDVITKKSRPIKLEALRVVSRALSTFHYIEGIRGAGPAVANAVQEGVYALLRILLEPLATGVPPADDEMSQVQCNYVLKLLHCRWDEMDFAFLRSVDLPRILFRLFSMWGADGKEHVQQSPSDPNHIQKFSEANTAIASNLFSACALKSAVSLASRPHPGYTKAGSQFLSQVFDCVAKDLKLSLAVLTGAAPHCNPVEKHEQHLSFLLTVTASVLRALSNAPFDCLVLGDMLPLLTSCVFLPRTYSQLSHYAMTNIRSLIPLMSIEQAEQGMAAVPLPDTPDISGPQRVGLRASIDAPEARGLRVVQLLVEIAGGFLDRPAAGGAASDAFDSGEALSLLRLLFLKNRVWQPSVVLWLQSVLNDPPVLSPTTTLANKRVKTFIVALNVLSGVPLSPRPGAEAEYCPRGSTVRTPVIIVEVNPPAKAVVVGSDLGLSSHEKEVDINALRLTSSSALDPNAFSSFLTVVRKLLPVLTPDGDPSASAGGGAGAAPPVRVAFPAELAQCVSCSFVVSKVLRCLAQFMALPSCAAKFLKEPFLLALLAALSVEGVPDPSTVEILEGKCEYLHELLESRDTSELQGTVATSQMQPPAPAGEGTAGGGGAATGARDATTGRDRQGMASATGGGGPTGAGTPSSGGGGAGSGGASGTSSGDGDDAKSARRQAAEELSHVLRGFELALCMKALEVAGDDKDKAAAILMDNSENIAEALEEETLLEERRRHEKRKKSLDHQRKHDGAAAPRHTRPEPLPHAIAFGPHGTGSLKLDLPDDSVASDFTMEVLLRVTGEGMFNKHRLHPDITPIIPLRAVHAGGAVEVGCCDGFYQVTCCGVSGAVPFSDAWAHIVVRCQGEEVDIYCDTKLISRSAAAAGNAKPISQVLLGPGLKEPATEIHPSLTIEIACFRVWGVAISPRQAEGLSQLSLDTTDTAVPLPSPTRLVASLCMLEGRGAEVRSTVGKCVGHLEGAVRWSCVGIPILAPETSKTRDTDDEPAQRSKFDSEIDVPRTEWSNAYQKADVERIARACCAVGKSLCVLYARRALESICEVVLGPGRAQLWGVDEGDFFANVIRSPEQLPLLLASIANLSPTGVDPAALTTLRSTVTSYLSTATSTEHIHSFVDGCVALLEDPPETYVYETPSHPYTPTDLILETVDMPGVTSYSITFDPRCRTLDYLYLYTDRTQKVQIAKFPDAQGQWTSLEVDKHSSFCIRFAGDAGAPSYWGYLFTVSVKTPRLQLAMEMLMCLLRAKEVVAKHNVCTSYLASHLAAAAHRETGRRRGYVLDVLTHLLGRGAQAFRACDIPRLGPLLKELRASAEQHMRQERPPPPGVVGPPKHVSRYLQALTELLVAAGAAEQAWARRQPFNLSTFTLQEATRRCYLSPSIRPTLNDLHPSPVSSLRCVCETTVRGKSLLFSQGVWRTAQATTGVMLGKWYYEVRLHSSEPAYIGWACETIDTPCGECSSSWSFCGNRGYKWHRDRSIYPAGPEQMTKWKGRDVVGVLLDLFTREMEFTINGKSLGVAFSRLPAVFYYPTITVGSSSLEVNFGENPFAYKPPPGYLPLHGGAHNIPGLPLSKLQCFIDACDSVVAGRALPPFFAGTDKDPFPNKAAREGGDVVELVALDGRPRVDHLTYIKSLANACTAKASAKVTKGGKWYYEVGIVSDGLMQVGWVTAAYTPDPVRVKGVGDDSRSWAYDGCRLLLRHRKEQNQIVDSRTWREGDIVGCLLDLDSGTMRFTLNGEPISSGSSSDAFTGLPVAEWYYPAVSMDPDNALEFNFGAQAFVYQPHGFRGIGTAWGMQALLEQPPNEPLPDAMPYRSRFETDAAMVTLVNALCDDGKVAPCDLRLKDQLAGVTLRNYKLHDVSPDHIHARILLLRQLNQLFRYIYPYVHLASPDRPVGLLADAVWKIKPLLMSATTHAILQHHVQAANAMVEAVQPKVTLNRRRAKLNRTDTSKTPDVTASLFGQVFTLLGDKHLNMYLTNRRFWSVSFQGEGAEDVGGPYRECLAEMCNELMSAALPLFIMSPNGKNNVGTHRDRMILNPKCNTHQLLTMVNFLGRLMAACMRSGEPLPLYISPLVWKVLAGDQLVASDLELVDKALMNSLLYLLRLDEEGVHDNTTFKELYDGVFTTELSSGEEAELIPGGSALPLTYTNRAQYVQHVIQKRLKESDDVMEQLRRGFNSVLPAHLVHLFTFHELERMVCGSPVWDVSELKAQARYEGLTAEDRRCRFFWQVLESFSEKERSSFLRFISGRERVPVRLKVMPLPVENPDSFLPVASTCFFWISLPDYSSPEVLKQKLLYAISNCTDIDTDYRVRGSIDENAPPTIGTGEVPDDDEFEDYTHLL